MEIITKNAQETKKFGQSFSNSLKGGETICLVGGLGAGKTTFVQGLAKGLNILAQISSPTFIIMRHYGVPALQSTGSKIGTLYHLDLYRFEKNVAEEIRNLGLFDIWEKPENIVVIEWAEKIKEILPKNSIWIDFKNISEEERKITVS